MKLDGQTRRPGPIFLGSALVLWLLAGPPARAASDPDALRLYEKALEQIDQGNPAAAIDSINSAMKIQPNSGKIRPYGMVFKGYYPHYALGRAYFEEGDFAAAVRELQTEQSRGFIQKDSDANRYETLKNYLGRARAKLKDAAGPAREETTSASSGPGPAAGVATPLPPGPGGGEKTTAPAGSGPAAGTPSGASRPPAPPASAHPPSTEPATTTARGSVPAQPPSGTSPRAGTESSVPGAGRIESKGIDGALAASLDSSDALLSHHRSFLGASSARSLTDLRARIDKARAARNTAETHRLGDQLKSRSAAADAAVRKASDAVRAAFRSAGQGRYPEAIQSLEQAMKAQPDVPAIRVALARLYFAEGEAKVPADDREVDRAKEQIRAAFVMNPDLSLSESFFPPQFVRMVRDARP